MMQHYDCDVDEIPFHRIQHRDGFHDAYLDANKLKKCFKRPCTFDALTGMPLKKARYKEGVGCVCDPTLGQFGVRLPGTYVRGPGYNACVSLFKEPLTQPIPVDIAAYFYLMQRPPVVFLQYHKLHSSQVIEPLRGLVKQGSLQIGQEFPYDFMQVFFEERRDYLTRTRNYHVGTYHLTQTQELFNILPNQMEWCRFISSHVSIITGKTLLQYPSLYRTAQQRNGIWTLLYRFPACYIGRNDLESPEMYRGRYVSNPFHMSLSSFPQDSRYNGIWLRYDRNKWFLKFAPPSGCRHVY
ncbi:hypothetical protein JTE90_016328 [Oedothorax gibbosus]|uniref:Uncharacterized protein n=1 Tax=Oedothorax gibbosus TaxID=931172 RepID=A0AAV6TPL5_9ARAC|nr:hypothetical protein JTE90_016328 [Oedothorax gibbosus]